MSTLHDDEPAAVDAFVDAESSEFWTRIRQMSSASYKPTIQTGVFEDDKPSTAHHGCADAKMPMRIRCGYADRGDAVKAYQPWLDAPAKHPLSPMERAAQLARQGYGWEDVVVRCGIAPDVARRIVWRVAS